MGCLTTNIMITLFAPKIYSYWLSNNSFNTKLQDSELDVSYRPFPLPPCWSMIQVALALSASLQSLSSKAGVGDAPSITMAHKNFGTWRDDSCPLQMEGN